MFPKTVCGQKKTNCWNPNLHHSWNQIPDLHSTIPLWPFLWATPTSHNFAVLSMLPVATCVPWKLKKVATSSWAKIDQAGQAGLPSEKKVTFINVNHAKADLPWFTCMALKKRRHFTRFWPKTPQICCSEFSFHLKVPGHPKICRTLNHVREITMKSSIVLVVVAADFEPQRKAL